MGKTTFTVFLASLSEDQVLIDEQKIPEGTKPKTHHTISMA